MSERFLEFDRTTLMDFYRRMQKAVREHSDKPVVTGGNIEKNLWGFCIL